MPEYHAAFLSRTEQCAGIREILVATGFYETVRYDNVVDIPLHRDDAALSVGHVLAVRFDSIRSDIVACLPVRFDIDYSSGQAVCLIHEYEVFQTFLQGSEAFCVALESHFSTGRADCLSQSFEVVQSYLGGSESWPVGYDQFFAAGNAFCLCQSFNVDQPYVQGAEAWPYFHVVFYSSGTSSCLVQTLDVDQHYIRGDESWPNHYESVFSSGSSICLIQTFDVFQPYVQSEESCCFGYEVVDGVLRDVTVLAQHFDSVQRDFQWFIDVRYSALAMSVAGVAGLHDMIVNGFNVPVASFSGIHDSLSLQHVYMAGGFNSVRYDAIISMPFALDLIRYCKIHQDLLTTTLVVDTFSGRPREIGQHATFDVRKIQDVRLVCVYHVPETSSQVIAAALDILKMNDMIARFQEEALYEYYATLVNVITSAEVTSTSHVGQGDMSSLRSFCTGDSLWEIELAAAVFYYDPNRPASFRDQFRWRFVTKEEKHWRQGPEISDLAVEALDSFFELRFSAEWPYRSIARWIDSWQFETPEEGDFFDLGVWTSDSLEIDTEAPPVLTLPWSCDIRNYAVHVPRKETTKFIAIAPIRKFPYEEIGKLAEIFIP